MEFKEKTIKESTIYKGKILNLRKDDVILQNGNHAIREVVEHSGGSAIYCQIDNKILLVKQFRYPNKEEIWEIPAGKKNDGETLEQTALRELEEECGLRAEKVEKLFDIYPSPAYTDEIISIYKAIKVKTTKMHLDEDEFLRCQWWEVEDVKKMINDGTIKDAKTIIAILSQTK